MNEKGIAIPQKKKCFPVRRFIGNISLFLMGFTLLVSALTKIFFGIPNGTPFPETVYYLVGGIELCFSLLIIYSPKPAAWFSIILAFSGVGLSVLSPKLPCGCLGRFLLLGKEGHFLLSSILGFFASIFLWVNYSNKLPSR